MPEAEPESLMPELEPDELKARFRTACASWLSHQPLRGSHRAGQSPTDALSQGEANALQRVGLSLEPFATSERTDPLARTVVDFMALLQSSYTTAEAAQLLGVNASRIRQKLKEHSLYAVRDEREWRLPRFQFEQRRPLPGLASVLAQCPADLNPLAVAEWFLLPNPDLESEDRDGEATSPRDWLLAGRPPAAVARLLREL